MAYMAKQAFIDFVNCYNSTEQHGFIVIDDILPESLYSCQSFRLIVCGMVMFENSSTYPKPVSFHHS